MRDGEDASLGVLYSEKLPTELAFWNAPASEMAFLDIPYVAFSVKF